jgi:hypothetical protein
MAARLLVIFGLLIVVATVAVWWLLSGFGCAMNTSGCASFTPDLSSDALTIVLPPIVLGIALGAFGIWKLRKG